jgi:hypothetical protein
MTEEANSQNFRNYIKEQKQTCLRSRGQEVAFFAWISSKSANI